MPPALRVEDLIVDLVEHPDRAITRRELARWGEAGTTLLNWGALGPGATLTSIACSACDEDHIVDLEFDATAGTWRYYCTWAGYVEADADELVTYAFDQDWLTSRLAELLSIRQLMSTTLIDGVMWRLGTARLGTRFWTAILVRDVDRHLNAIDEQVRLLGRGHPGLLLSSTTNVPTSPRPNDCRWLPLRQLLDAEGNRLAVHETAIVDALRVRKRDGPVGKAGRPSAQDDIIGELKRRAEAGVVLGILAEEARTLADWSSKRTSQPRSPRTVENIIRSTFKNLKPRPTK